MFRYALVRRPSKKIQASRGLTDVPGSRDRPAPLDAQKVISQWENYVDAFYKAGWEVAEIPGTTSDLAGLFIDQAAVVYRTVAMIGAGANLYPVEDYDVVHETLDERGLATVRVKDPVRVSGSDVEVAGTVVHVARTPETNSQGIAEVRRLFTPLGLRVVGVPLGGMQHLKKSATRLPDQTTIGDPEALSDTRVFECFVPAPEPLGASVIGLSEDTVMVSAAARGTAALLQNIGYRVVSVDISEFERFGASLTSISLRWHNRS